MLKGGREGRERGRTDFFCCLFFFKKRNYRKSTYTVEVSMFLLRMWLQNRN